MQSEVAPEKEIAERPAPAECHPALGSMMLAVVQQMASLAKRVEIAQPVIGRVMVEVRCGEDDARAAATGGLEQIRPAGRAVASVTPPACASIEPAAVRQASQRRLVRPAAAFALAGCPAEAHGGAQRSPMRWIKRAKLGTDRHGGDSSDFCDVGES